MIRPGKAGTVPHSSLNIALMGDGSGKPVRVIVADTLMHYVGIGWIEERQAEPADADTYPVADFGPHYARF